MTRTTIVMAAGLALAATLSAVPAQALTSRAWISGHGTDAPSCGSVATPCHTPQYAHDNIVAAGGEIDILDPAGYGAITITKAISIVNDGVGTAGMLAPAAGNAITINAGASDAIQLRGLTIEGSGVGYNGTVFNSGGSLTVTNCVVQNFAFSGSPGLTTGNGILMQPTSGTISFAITNTIVSNNGFFGITYAPPSGSATANGVIDHVVTTNNQNGVQIFTGHGGGSTTVAISNSIASNNTTDGIFIDNGSTATALTASIDNTGISANTFGLAVFDTANVLLGRSVITSNSNLGISNGTSPNTFFSYHDNRINGNGTDIGGTALNTHALQ
jgi:hypothetical protein